MSDATRGGRSATSRGDAPGRPAGVAQDAITRPTLALVLRDLDLLTCEGIRVLGRYAQSLVRDNASCVALAVPGSTVVQALDTAEQSPRSLPPAPTDPPTRAATTCTPRPTGRSSPPRPPISATAPSSPPRYGIPADEAFDLLRRTSQDLNIKLVDLATTLANRHTDLDPLNPNA